MTTPLPKLYSRVLTATSDAYDLPTIEDSTQDIVKSCIEDLCEIQTRISDLALFSSNETLDDISTQNLIYLTVPYVCAEVQGRVRTTEREDRFISIVQAQNHYETYCSTLENYGIVTEGDSKLFSRNATNAASKREQKIQQYHHEKDLRTRIEVIHKRKSRRPTEELASGTTDFILISSLLPSATASGDEDEDDEVLRETVLLLLRLFYSLSKTHLAHIDTELQLLKTAPPPLPYSPRPDDNDPRKKEKDERDEDMWKLDAPKPNPGGGPLLDPAGKPLRPFTILPFGASDRARHQAQVFGPGYNLPTMTIDQYLEVERQRGNILSGGGPGSENMPTSSEQLAMDAEIDGTIKGEAKAEEKRLKDENWAKFTDENPRGAGNTMNRG
ncbi:TAP42-like protein [Guyanagaster necrorhizus]|uniref:TAP42-like protein n=1 Tax=Guyanagaster necrorhizus TaxID=856835 RepID=A0A9P7VYF2_9AGAR|nr:TAP42-like protein [Guyanagaster necrorhizus MCA 3950]KAG7448121.1 TAP42-like protein [Guyanagaster necrorhizus MCA 3950]